MGRLSSEQILQDKQTRDPNSITALTLDHKALSDVSCLADFKNLEKLDLGFNNLSSLEGLKSCINLKWLSIIENKLQSLKGIEGLTKLTVLNAGKNNLKSMDEIKSLVSLRALILNDNEIVSICSLDQLQNLNTLVLSRNPVRDIGKSLTKVKSMTKFSLSKCQIQTIDSSLKFCTELKELRLSHNNISNLPAELAHNKKLQNLDLGNNSISTWSALKVLSSLVNLKNLNLQGNPIAENEKSTKKICKLVPDLQIYNARPTDKNRKNEKRNRILEVDDPSLTVANKLEVQEDEERNQSGGDKNKKSKHHVKSYNKDDHLDNTDKDLDVVKKTKLKKQKTDDKLSKEDSTLVEQDSKRKSKKLKGGEVNAIDDGETPFMDLINVDTANDPQSVGQTKTDDDNKAALNVNSGVVVTFPAKKEKMKKKGMETAAFELLSNYLLRHLKLALAGNQHGINYSIDKQYVIIARRYNEGRNFFFFQEW